MAHETEDDDIDLRHNLRPLLRIGIAALLLEVIAITNDGTVAVLSVTSGSEFTVYEREVPIWTFPTITNIDSDGSAEILI